MLNWDVSEVYDEACINATTTIESVKRRLFDDDDDDDDTLVVRPSKRVRYGDVRT